MEMFIVFFSLCFTVPSDEDEQEGRFLVDFHQKTIPKVKI